MMEIYEKRWRNVLHHLPREGEIVKCLAICFDDRYAGYSESNYQWYKGQWWPQANAPKLDDSWVLTHWLDDPRVYPPLPEGWPVCDIAVVHEWLKPYIDERKKNAIA